KNLFFCYTNYIRYSVNQKDSMNEGNDRPGTNEQIQVWLKKLNKWFPVQINGNWTSCDGSFIGTPQGFYQVIEALHKTTKFKNYQVTDDNTATEPYIGEEKGKILFGLVDMEGAQKEEIPDNSNVFEKECPEECNKEMRKWICKICGEY